MAAVPAGGWRGQLLFAWTTKPNGHYHTSHKHEAFSALVIEPQGRFASRFSPKLLKQTFQRRVRILTSQTSWPDMTSQAKSPPPPNTTLPLSHYIVNVRLLQWSKTFHLANESPPTPTILCLPLGLLTPRWPHQLHEKQLIKALTAAATFSWSLHSLTCSSVESGVSPPFFTRRFYCFKPTAIRKQHVAGFPDLKTHWAW